MSDYIEREAARQAHIKASLTTRLIDAQPAADVAPVRHGRWWDVGSLSCRCSECGCKSGLETRCCPHCGARMDVEREDKDAD